MSMNERIQELWRECVLKHTNDPMNWQTVADEFAGLIVRECASLCEIEGDSYKYSATLVRASWSKAVSNQCVKRIRKHFGVEE